jgi:hypothetical protein
VSFVPNLGFVGQQGSLGRIITNNENKTMAQRLEYAPDNNASTDEQARRINIAPQAREMLPITARVVRAMRSLSISTENILPAWIPTFFL